MNYVYIMECRDGSLYTGWTNNLEKRFKDHSEGKGAKYTRGRGPFKIIYFETFEEKSDALKRECEIKSFTRYKKLELVKNKVLV